MTADTDDTTDTALCDSIRSAIGMSGGLFQRHPDHPEWDTTRPGARPGEVACFKREVPDERTAFISVCFHREGETRYPGADPDNTWGQDVYEIHVSHGSYQQRDVATTVEDAAELVAREMERLADD